MKTYKVHKVHKVQYKHEYTYESVLNKIELYMNCNILSNNKGTQVLI